MNENEGFNIAYLIWDRTHIYTRMNFVYFEILKIKVQRDRINTCGN